MRGMRDGAAVGKLGAALENATQNFPSPTPIIHPHDFCFKNCNKILEKSGSPQEDLQIRCIHGMGAPLDIGPCGLPL